MQASEQLREIVESLLDGGRVLLCLYGPFLLQAFFQNPMAGPYVVGVSAGAGLLAVASITLGINFQAGPLDGVSIAAFLGGLGTIALVYALARRIRFLQAEGLLLIGIAVGAVCSALTSILLLFGRDGAQAALAWMFGSFAAWAYAAAARCRSKPNLFSFFPVLMYLWVWGSTSGLTRKAIRPVTPNRRAHSEMRTASGSDSTVKKRMPSFRAYSISSAVLPTPA